MNVIRTVLLPAIIAAIIIFSFGSRSVSVSLGQAVTNSNNFANYDNPKFGFSIKYPENWAKEITDDLDLGQDVTFLVTTSPIKYGEKVSVMITNETGKSLDEIVNHLINFNKNESPAMKGANYQVVESVPVDVHSISAHKLVNTYSDKKFGNVKSLQILMLKGDKLYTILYTSEHDKYDTLLPIVQMMIDSFQFIK